MRTSFYEGPIQDGVSRLRALLGLVALLVTVLVCLLLAVIAALLAGLGEQMVAEGTGVSAPDPAPAELLISLLLMPVVFGPGALLAGWAGLGRSPAKLISTRGGFRLRVFTRACVPAAVVALASTAIFGLASGSSFAAPTITLGLAVTLAALLVVVPVQALAEELVFRGVLVQLLVVIFPRWRAGSVPWGLVLAAGVSAVCFAAIHGGTSPALMLATFLGALLWTWLAHRLGGLEAATAAHFVFNFLLFAFPMLGLLPAESDAAAGATALLQVFVTDVAMAAGIWLYLTRLRPRGVRGSGGHSHDVEQAPAHP